ncbi:MAG: RNA pseudouridine synthase [Polynucleobacter sp. 39-45-136]|nr:MAG: RNA pseudouridine synthase [Polynucleobacter sp. 39-45-136]
MKSEPISKPLAAKTATAAAVHLQTIGPEEAGQRLDNYLLRWAKGVPKSHVYRIIRSGEVRVNKKRAEPTTRLVEGDIVRVPPVRIAEPAQMAAVNTAQTKSRAQGYSDKMPILFEDEALLIVNKPAGLAVHGGSGIALGVIETLRITRPELKFLELVHRLDRDTSGVLLLAKKRSALVELHRQIREGQTDKRYYLLAHGEIAQGPGVMQLKYPLHKYLLANGERRVRVDPDGLPSHTALRVTKVMKREDATITMAEAQLKTGRTHQIRVHLQIGMERLWIPRQPSCSAFSKLVAIWVLKNPMIP